MSNNIKPNLYEMFNRYQLPGERRVVEAAAAARFRALVLRAAKDLGFDRVTASVVLIDLAVEQFAQNVPKYEPHHLRETLERAVVHHFGPLDSFTPELG